ncbi:phosphopantetheine-binding protein [Candidatus Methylocalor cossyra]|uniref:Phosphopantetheine-binding protein n=1 Tax=Candidatus Methylocalor cossyra TaxID=3108543 RepID=A0ABM9NHD5_9GAMM
MQLTPLELEVARLVVESLNLEQAPTDLDPETPLYREGLGLDSIDLLELSVVISKRYGFQLKSDDPDIATIFSSLRALASTIEKRRTK